MSGEQSLDDGSSQLQWNGQWQVETDSSYEEGSCHVTSQKGASMVLSFEGTSISIYGNGGPDFGSFEVQCDDESVTNNARMSEDRVTVLLFQRNGWALGQHHCVVTNVGSNKFAIDTVVIGGQATSSSTTASSTVSSSASRSSLNTASEPPAILSSSSKEKSQSESESTQITENIDPTSQSSRSDWEASSSSLDTLTTISKSESDSKAETTRNAAVIGGIAGAAFALMALIFILWRCAKRKQNQRHSGPFSTVRSDDDGQAGAGGVHTRDIGHPVFKSSTMDTPGDEGEKPTHQVKLPWSGSDSGDSDFKPHPFSAAAGGAGPVSAFTMADGSNVEASALPKPPDSPSFSIHSMDSSATKHSIPRVPPPAPPAAVLPALPRAHTQPLPTSQAQTKFVPRHRTQASDSMYQNPRVSTVGSDWTLAAGSADQTPMLGEALTTEDPAPSSRVRPPSRSSSHVQLDHQLPEIHRVTRDRDLEEVLSSPRRKQRSATLTWLRGPWD